MPFSEWSVLFDGVDEYADAGQSYDFDRTDVFSISYWVRAGASAGSEFIVAKGAVGPPQGWWSMLRSDGKVVFGMVNTTTTDDLRVRADNVNLRDGVWHHVVVTHDGTGTAAGINHIIDGVLASAYTESNTLASTISNTATLRFATRENGYPSESLAGSLDEIAFYNKELSLAEAQAIYNAGNPPDLSGLSTAGNLIAWWRMGDGDFYPTLANQIEYGEVSVPNVPDLGPNVYSGTMVNMLASDIHTDVPRSSYCKYSTYFDGVADYYTMGDVHGFEYTDTFSISCWFRAAAGSANGYLVSKRNTTVGVHRGWGLFVDVAGEVALGLCNTNLTNAMIVRTVGAYADDQWHHIVATWDGNVAGGAAGAHLFVDGVDDTDPTPDEDNLSATILNASSLNIGARDDSANFYGGSITEVTIHNVELSQAEVTTIYNAGSPKSLKGYSPLTTSLDLNNDTVDEYVNFQALPIPEAQLGQGFTQGAWIKCSTRPSPSELWTVVWRARQTAYDRDVLLRLWDNGAGAGGMRVDFQGPYANVGYQYHNTVTSFGVDLFDGNWHFIAVTWPGDPTYPWDMNLIEFICDGASATHNYTSGSPPQSLAYPETLQIGARRYYAYHEDFFIGQICHSFVYNQGLSASEVALLYNSGAPADLLADGMPADLVHWSTLGDGCATGTGNMVDLAFSSVPYSPLTTSIEMTAVPFPGPYEYVEVPRFSAIDFALADPCSMGVWVKYTSSGGQTLLCKQKVAGVSAGWLLYITSTDIYATYEPEGASGGWGSRWAGKTANDGQWHLIMFTWDGSTAPTIYVDGATATLATGSGYPDTGDENGKLLFGFGVDLNEGFTGKMCHGFVYDKELSAAEVVELYGRGEPQDLSQAGPTGNLVYWSALGDGDGLGTGNILDLSGGGHTGTYLNGDSGDFVADVPVGVLGGTTVNVETTDFVADAPFPSALVAWWRLGSIERVDQQVRDLVWGSAAETSTIRDMSRYPYHMAPAGVAPGDFTTDTPGGTSKYSVDLNGHLFSKLGIRFQASPDYVDMGDVLAFERTDAFSFSVWVRTNLPGTKTILGKIGNATTYLGYWLFMDASEYLVFRLIADQTTSNEIHVRNNDNASWRDYNWHHIVVTYSGATQTDADVTMYIDGSPVATTTVQAGPITATTVDTSAFQLGNIAAANYPWGGYAYMDEVSVYDKELSASDVTWIYNSGVPRDLLNGAAPSNLQAWWRGDGDTYPTLTDNSVPNTTYSPLTTSIELNNGSSDESCDFPSPLTIPATGQAFTMGCWFKTSSSTTPLCLMAKEYNGSDYNWAIVIGNLTLSACQSNGVSNWAYRQNSGFNYRDGVWRFVALIHDGVDWTNVQLYVGGQGFRPITGTGSLALGSPESGGKLIVGGVRNPVTVPQLQTPYDGQVCHEFMYNKALSGSELAALYNGGAPADLSTVGPTGNLVHWCALGDGDAIGAGNLLDLSSSALDGTYTNGDSGDFLLDVPSNGVAYDGTMNSMSSSDLIPEVPAVRYLRTTVGDPQLTFGTSSAEEWFVSAWIKTTETDGVIVHRAYSSSNDMSGWGARLNGGYPSIWWSITWPNTRTEQRSNVLVTDGAWHHIVMHRRRAQSSGAPICQFWVDGVQTGRVTVLDANLNNTITAISYVSIGAGVPHASSADGGFPFVGQIAEVAVFGGRPTQAIVDDLYNGGSPPDLTLLSSEKRLFGYWRCGDDSGNPGTPVSIAASARKGDAPGEEYSTRALDFRSTANTYLTMGNVLNYGRLDPFSISTWFRMEGTSGHGLISKSGSTFTDGYILYQLYDDQPWWRFNGPTGEISIEFGWTGIILPFEWYHLVITYDGSGTAAGTKMYIDGVDIGQYRVYADNLTTDPITTYPLNIGREGTSSYYWEGPVDETSFWGKELSQAEVTELYNVGAPGDLELHSAWADIDAWWRMGEGKADALMINMEAGDIKNQAPALIKNVEANIAGDASVTALAGFQLDAEADLAGDSSMTGELLGESEIAADLAGDASVTAVATVDYGAAAEIAGGSEIVGHAIVRTPPAELTYSGPLDRRRVPERTAGFQPGREPVVKEPKLTVEVNPRRRR